MAAAVSSDLAGLQVFEAWRLITAERGRQIVSEGWSAAHDDAHDAGDLLRAGVCYLHYSGVSDDPPVTWPWDREWWKPKSRRRNLVRAGALCLAERDRCVRNVRHTGPADHKLGVVLRELVLDLTAPGGSA